MVDKDVDILIVGGGIIGATLMLALAPLGFRLCMIDTRALSFNTASHFDARSLALSPASIRILKQLGVWSKVEQASTAIRNIHISQEGQFGQARLIADGADPLGSVLEMQALSQVLWSLIDHSHVVAPATLTQYDRTTQTATLKTDLGERLLIRSKLIVAADGSNSSMRKFCKVQTKIKNYNQEAVVANIGLARAHQHWAYERFTKKGPIALLPLSGKRSSLIWTQSPEDAQHLMLLTDNAFLQALQHTFGYRLGRFVSVGRRTSFPLREVTLAAQVVDGVVFVGNAAHTLHPVAGQGFNLGLRDVAMLAECIAATGLSPETLQRYQALRHSDQSTILSLTDGLIQLFSNQFPGVSHARSLGLMALDNVSFLKRILTRYAGGFGGELPALLCGLPLGIKDTSCMM